MHECKNCLVFGGQFRCVRSSFRFNVGCSKRINLYKSEDSPTKKLKEGLESESDFERKDAHLEEMETDGQSGNFDADVAEENDLAKTPKVDILKWTVSSTLCFLEKVKGRKLVDSPSPFFR